MNLSPLINTLELTPEDPELLARAFVHRSYLNEHPTYTRGSNERLEFLGDAILEFLVTQYVFSYYPDEPEGELTDFRSAVVSTRSLASISAELKLGDYLRMSKGEEDSGGRKKPSILADTFEAMLGAIYLDQGLRAVEKVLEKTIFPKIPKIVSSGVYRDSKSTLQEVVQADQKISPDYTVVDQTGPDHEKVFTVEVRINGKTLGRGKGSSKQTAEIIAARNALDKYDNIKT